jgi:hypothetical protein
MWVGLRVCFATEPGSPAKPNEDFVQATPRVVAVLDGLGVPGGLLTGCVHGTPWYVRGWAVTSCGSPPTTRTATSRT